MKESFTELPIEDAYAELRRILLDMKCQLLLTIPPNAIEVRQGSWVGFTPVNMAKHLRFRLYGEREGTRIQTIAYWPMVLTASLVVFYTACFVLLSVIASVMTQLWQIPLLLAPLGPVILGLIGLIIFLAIVHVYSYLLRSNVNNKILNLLKARGSVFHRQIKEARLRKREL